MKLSRYNLKNIQSTELDLPDEKLFDLPEKVLQFGTGVLLRGLPEYFIDKANRNGIFNGRIVVVKSTNAGDTLDFDKQDGLYTLCVRGVENGEKKKENIINASISRVLSASNQWEQILDCAHNMHMKVIISNTTEVGIQLVHEDIRKHPPVSFPGKLLAFLYARYAAFAGSEESGMVIVPTELIVDNGKKLESIVLELAHLNGLEDGFIQWLECCNHFCSSLVDRIVPGRPDKDSQNKLEGELGYKDNLLIMSEVYRLWAIEGGEEVKRVLSFAEADEGVVIEPDIELYRELKLRVLNGTHTLSCGLAYLAGYETVMNAMQDEKIAAIIADLIKHEIASSIPLKVDPEQVQEFCVKVLDRFRNPQIQHHWIAITTQFSSKMKMRIIPVLLKHYEQFDHVPELITLGFASYLYFMKAVKQADGKFYGELNGRYYVINDDLAEVFMRRWELHDPSELVEVVLSDSGFWGVHMNALPGFSHAVLEKLNLIIKKGAKETIEFVQSKKVFA